MRRCWIFASFIFSLAVTGCSADTMASGQNTDTYQKPSAAGLSATAGLPTTAGLPSPAVPPSTASQGDSQLRKYPVSAQSSSGEPIDFVLESEGIYCICNGTAYGFMTEDGEEVSPYDYEDASPFSQGLACVSRQGKYGFIDAKGNTALPFIYDDSAPFQEGLAYFSRDGRYGFMDKSGNPVFYLDCDSVSSFREGMAYFSVKGKYGYIDGTGKTVIEPVYEDAGYFQDGFGDIMKNGKHGLIDRRGNRLLSPDYDSISRQEDIFIVQSKEKYGCFDLEGNPLLPVDYDDIVLQDGMLCLWKDGKAGLASLDGTVILKPAFQSMKPIPGSPFAIARDNNQWGVVDFQGNIKQPFIYRYISCSSGQEKNVLTVNLDGKIGFMSVADLSELIPPTYDGMSEVVNDRAVVKLDGKSGVVNTSGALVIQVSYDKIRLFENGSMAVTKAGVTSLLDNQGEVVNTGKYDEIFQEGDCYEVVAEGKTGFLDKTGRESIPPQYDFVFPGSYSSPEVEVAGFYGSSRSGCIIKTGRTGEADLSGALLKNKITPKLKPYQEFAIETQGKGSETGKMAVEYPQGLDECDVKTYKLYDIDGSGKPILYFYAEPLTQQVRPLSCSGFYSMNKGGLHKLLTGYQCGGTLGGDRACFWYDGEARKLLLGTEVTIGGFGGRSYGGTVYEYRNGEAAEALSFNWVNQTVGNYDEEVLLKDAGLFYDENGKPYNRDGISKAEWVTECTVNGIRTTMENYEKTVGRYQQMEM